MLKKEARTGRRPPKRAEPKSKRMKKEFMSFAGIWSDIDADELIDRIMRARHEAPPSDPVIDALSD